MASSGPGPVATGALLRGREIIQYPAMSVAMPDSWEAIGNAGPSLRETKGPAFGRGGETEDVFAYQCADVDGNPGICALDNIVPMKVMSAVIGQIGGGNGTPVREVRTNGVQRSPT